MTRSARSTLTSAPGLYSALLLSATILLMGATPWTRGGEGADMTTPNAPRPQVQQFSLDELRARRAEQNSSYLEFLSEPVLRMGLYHLPAGATDGQSPHGQDEVYYVASGSGVLEVDGVDHPAAAGSVFYVRAEVPHRFHSITADLDVLVVFSTIPMSDSDPKVLGFSASEQIAARATGENVWSPFLNVATMTLGMYMLPQAVGGGRDPDPRDGRDQHRDLGVELFRGRWRNDGDRGDVHRLRRAGCGPPVPLPGRRSGRAHPLGSVR